MQIDKELWLALKHGAGFGGILKETEFVTSDKDTEFIDDDWG